jgi:hypothetical protein
MRGRLTIEGRTTLRSANIDQMRELCRVPQRVRLWLRPEEGSFDGSLRKRAMWVIRDGPRKISTGCAAEDREGAERALGDQVHLNSPIPCLRAWGTKINGNDHGRATEK